MNKNRLITFWKESKILRDNAVINAFLKVNRGNFILPQYKEVAYHDFPLPIPAGQTISQPTTVAIMTEALKLKKGMKVLEVGAGSGYQAAIIAETVDNGHVYTTEIIKELAAFARKNLKKEKITNVTIVHYDGSIGYSKQSPYDRIIITAACPKVPEPLLQQLKDNGILLAPVGSGIQQLLRITRKKDKFFTENLGEFVFVPLTGKLGFK